MAVLKKAVDKEKVTITDAYNASVKSTQAAIDSLTGSVQKMQAIAQKLKSSADSLAPMSYGDARAQIAASLAIARAGGGVNDATGDLSRALDAIAKPNEAMYKTYVDFQRDQLIAANNVSELSGYADTQLSVAQDQLTVLKDGLTIAKNQYDQQIKNLDQTMIDAQAQIDAVNGVTTAVMSVADAITGLSAAIRAQQELQAAHTAKIAADKKAADDKAAADQKAIQDAIDAKAAVIAKNDAMYLAMNGGFDYSKPIVGSVQDLSNPMNLPAGWSVSGHAMGPFPTRPALGASSSDIMQLSNQIENLATATKAAAASSKKTADLLTMVTQNGTSLLTTVA